MQFKQLDRSIKMMVVFLISIYSFTLILAGPVCSENIPVYILAGQSNMFGLAKKSEIGRSLENWLNNNDVFFYYNGDKREDLGKSGRIIKNIVAPNKLLHRISSGSGYDFGPELKFSQLMSVYHGKRIAVIKYAKNAMQLAQHRDNETFYVGLTSNDRGKYFKELLETINNAMEQLRKHGDPYLVGMVWMQGESDAGLYEHPRSYEKNLLDFIDTIRIESNRNNLPIIIGKIPLSGFPFTNLVRAAQSNVCKERPNVICVETDSFERYFLPCNFDNYPDSLSFCNVHFTANGQIQLGRGFSDAAKTVAPK